jgi:mono/diheme cytochrome c family protein
MSTPYASPMSLVRLQSMRRTSLVALLLALVLGLLAAGCLSGTETTATPETVVGSLPEATTSTGDLPALKLTGDATAGKAIFATKGCTGCHTLAAAGSSGTVGPNLDQAKPPTELVVTRVTKGQGAMPSFADQLDPQQIADVAAYVVKSTSG